MRYMDGTHKRLFRAHQELALLSFDRDLRPNEERRLARIRRRLDRITKKHSREWCAAHGETSIYDEAPAEAPAEEPRVMVNFMACDACGAMTTAPWASFYSPCKCKEQTS